MFMLLTLGAGALAARLAWRLGRDSLAWWRTLPRHNDDLAWPAPTRLCPAAADRTPPRIEAGALSHWQGVAR